MTNQNSKILNVFETSDIRAMKKSIKNGADINVTNAKSWTYLMIAAGKGDADCVKSLIKAGADVDFQDRYDGYNALIVASSNNNVSCVKEIVQSVKNIDAESYAGETALSIAADKMHKDCAKVLVFAGASVNFLEKPSVRQEYKKLVAV